MSASATPPERYGAVAIALHWASGIALLAQIAFGFLLDDLAPPGTPARTGVINHGRAAARGLVAGHIAVAIAHAACDRGALFARMWPHGGAAAPQSER
jgi:cytochrome b561